MNLASGCSTAYAVNPREDGMEKEISITEFAKELKERLQSGKSVDCCKAELLRLADLITEKIGDETIIVTWKD